jgi:hypothetical protein
VEAPDFAPGAHVEGAHVAARPPWPLLGHQGADDDEVLEDGRRRGDRELLAGADVGAGLQVQDAVIGERGARRAVAGVERDEPPVAGAGENRPRDRLSLVITLLPQRCAAVRLLARPRQVIKRIEPPALGAGLGIDGDHLAGGRRDDEEGAREHGPCLDARNGLARLR